MSDEDRQPIYFAKIVEHWFETTKQGALMLKLFVQCPKCQIVSAYCGGKDREVKIPFFVSDLGVESLVELAENPTLLAGRAVRVQQKGDYWNVVGTAGWKNALTVAEIEDIVGATEVERPAPPPTTDDFPGEDEGPLPF